MQLAICYNSRLPTRAARGRRLLLKLSAAVKSDKQRSSSRGIDPRKEKQIQRRDDYRARRSAPGNGHFLRLKVLKQFDRIRIRIASNIVGSSEISEVSSA